MLGLADPSVCLMARHHELRRWPTAVNVKLLLPPRQSRGNSHKGLGHYPVTEDSMTERAEDRLEEGKKRLADIEKANDEWEQARR